MDSGVRRQRKCLGVGASAHCLVLMLTYGDYKGRREPNQGPTDVCRTQGLASSRMVSQNH